MYNKIVEKINKNNPKFDIIKDPIREKLLNFNELLPHEQLHLLTTLKDMSKTTEHFPKDITKIIDKFPYLDTVPDNVFATIGDSLREKNPKKNKNISSFGITSRRSHSLFQLDQVHSHFLFNVAIGKQNAARKATEKIP